MDKRLRCAPDPEWVLMYRLGLGRSRIALVPAAPETVGYHLGIARRQDPDLEPAHLAAATLPPGPLARIEDVIVWVTKAAEKEDEGLPCSVLNESPASASRAVRGRTWTPRRARSTWAGSISSLAKNWQRNRCEVMFPAVGECDQKSQV